MCPHCANLLCREHNKGHTEQTNAGSNWWGVCSVIRRERREPICRCLCYMQHLIPFHHKNRIWKCWSATSVTGCNWISELRMAFSFISLEVTEATLSYVAFAVHCEIQVCCHSKFPPNREDASEGPALNPLTGLFSLPTAVSRVSPDTCLWVTSKYS